MIRRKTSTRYGFNGRYTYAGGNRNATPGREHDRHRPRQHALDRAADLCRRGGQPPTRIWRLYGGVFAFAKWTFTNTTSINNTRIDGRSAFVEAACRHGVAGFEHLGIRYIIEHHRGELPSDAEDWPLRCVPLFRRAGSGRMRHCDFPVLIFMQGCLRARTKSTRALAGFRLAASQRPAHFGGRRGRAAPASRSTPLSDRRFHTETARWQWRKTSAVFSGSFQNAINRNPSRSIDHSSESRQFGLQGRLGGHGAAASASTPVIPCSTSTPCRASATFSTPAIPRRRAISFYTSNLHIVNFGSRIQPHARLTLYLGYNLAKDTADGRGASELSRNGVTPNYPNFATTERVSSTAIRSATNRRWRGLDAFINQALLELRLASLQLQRRILCAPELPRPRRLLESPLELLSRPMRTKSHEAALGTGRNAGGRLNRRIHDELKALPVLRNALISGFPTARRTPLDRSVEQNPIAKLEEKEGVAGAWGLGVMGEVAPAGYGVLTY